MDNDDYDTFRDMRKKLGEKINPATAFIGRRHVPVMDPYEFSPDFAGVCSGTYTFVRNRGSKIWIITDDLPPETNAALDERTDYEIGVPEQPIEVLNAAIDEFTCEFEARLEQAAKDYKAAIKEREERHEQADKIDEWTREFEARLEQAAKDYKAATKIDEWTRELEARLEQADKDYKAAIASYR